MELEFTTEEMISIMKEKHKSEIVNTMHQMIKLYRHMEKEKQECDRVVGGVECLYSLVTQGWMKLDMYLKILPAIENYNTPYEIKLTS